MNLITSTFFSQIQLLFLYKSEKFVEKSCYQLILVRQSLKTRSTGQMFSPSIGIFVSTQALLVLRLNQRPLVLPSRVS